MSPENARVFLTEDDEVDAWRTKEYLKRGDHSVELRASTLEEALGLVPRLEKEGINVAVVDGNLSSGKRDGADGERVVTAIRKQAPGVKIVVYSGGSYDYGDVRVPKPEFSPGFKESDRSPKIEEIVREI
jgi:ActR/RegA family two-component response regulator